MTQDTLTIADLVESIGRVSTFGAPGRLKRVEESDLDTLYPSAGRVCKTTDTQTMFWGDGSQWISVPDALALETSAAVFNPEDLTARTGHADGEHAVHDGSGTPAAGTYRWDSGGAAWVKVEDNTVTI